MYEVHSTVVAQLTVARLPVSVFPHSTYTQLVVAYRWGTYCTSWLVSGCVCRKLLLERCLDIERLETLKMDDDYLL